MAERPKEYDVFVSYAEQDRAWVKGVLFDAFLEAGITYIDEDQFGLGEVRTEAAETAMRASRRLVIVLSHAYEADRINQTILDMSRHLKTSRQIPLIPIYRDPDIELPTDIEMLIHLDMSSEEDREEKLAKLREALGKEIVKKREIPDCPYVGMLPYTEQWDGPFYGRDGVIDELVDLLRYQQIVTVTGPSGSGKSSVVRAGLFHHLRNRALIGDGPWTSKVITPGRVPFTKLAGALGVDDESSPQDVATALRTLTTAADLLLVIDQAEQMLALGTSDREAAEAEMVWFAEVLASLEDVERLKIVFTLRSDFAAELGTSPLDAVTSDTQYRLEPLRGTDLRDAIERPAENVGVYVEPALVEAIQKDAATEPGLLPFVQETMVMLWGRIERRYVTLSGYRALVEHEALVLPRREYPDLPRTGLQVAMAGHASRVMKGIKEANRPTAFRVLIRLVEFLDGRSDVRRQRSLPQLQSSSEEPSTFNKVLSALSDGRLVTTDEGKSGSESAVVDLSHESLISGWPQLTAWIAAHRDVEAARRELEQRADEWEKIRDNSEGFGGALAGWWSGWVRGDRLLDHHETEEAETWRDHEQADRLGLHEPRIERLVAASKAWLLRRRFAFVGFLGLAALIGVLGIFAIDQRNQAEAEANRATAFLLAQTADADPEQQDIAALLGLEAVVRLDSIESRAGLKTALELSPQVIDYLPGHDDAVLAVATSVDGNRFATGGAGNPNLLLWDVRRPDQPTSLSGHEDEVTTLAFSDNGRWLASGSRDDTVRVWDLDDLSAAPRVLVAGEPTSTDGECRCARSQDGQFIDCSAGIASSGGPGGGGLEFAKDVRAVAFSPGSAYVAMAGHNALVELFATDTWEARVPLDGHLCDITDLAFHPDRPWIASASRDDTVRVWDLESGEVVLMLGEPTPTANDEGDLRAVAWHPDGTRLAYAGNDKRVKMFEVDSDNETIIPTNHNERVFDLSFDPSGRFLASASADRTINVASVGGVGGLAAFLTELKGHRDAVRGLAYTPKGVLISGAQDGTVIRWDPARTIRLATSLAPGGSTPRVVATTSSLVVVGTAGGEVVVWSLGEERSQPRVLSVSDDEIRDIAAVGDEAVVVVDAAGGITVVELPNLRVRSWPAHEGDAQGVVYVPWADAIVTAGLDGTLRSWGFESGRLIDEQILVDCPVDDIAVSPAAGAIAVACNSSESWLVGLDGPGFSGSIVSYADRRLITVEYGGGGVLYGGGEDGRLLVWPDPAAESSSAVAVDIVGDEVRAIAIDEEGGRGAFGTEGGAVFLWDLESGRVIGSSWMVGLQVGGLAFTRDGQGLVAVGTGGSTDADVIVVLNTDEDSWRSEACRVARRNLTTSEWDQIVGTDVPAQPCNGPVYVP